MKSPNLFSSPLIVGTMRLGKWGANFSTQEYERFIQECIDLGLYEFDLADVYGDYTTEREFGEVLKKNPRLRNKITATTKCGIRMATENRPEHYIKSYDLSGQHIIDSAEQSLKKSWSRLYRSPTITSSRFHNGSFRNSRSIYAAPAKWQGEIFWRVEFFTTPI